MTAPRDPDARRRRQLFAALVGDEFADAAADGDRPWVRVAPGTMDEAAAVVELAAGHGLTVWPGRGEGHVDGDVVLDLRRLNRVIAHHPQNLVAAVECGMPWAAFQQALATAAGQCVPLDPPGADRTTVGAVLAGNAFGPLRLGRGTARDWLIGATIIRHDGKLIRTGGMVVKNVSGYDLGKLHIGSRGTLGVIVRANFKLAPLPAASGLLQVRAANRADAWQALAVLRARPLGVVSAVRGDDGRMWVGLESSSPGALALQRDDALASLAQAGHADASWLADDEARAAYADSVAPLHAPALFRLRIHVLPAQLAAILDAAARPAGTVETWLVGSGVAWWQCESSPDVAALRRVAGHVTIEQQPAGLDATQPRVAIADPVAAAMTRNLKAALDPDGRFPSLPLG